MYMCKYYYRAPTTLFSFCPMHWRIPRILLNALRLDRIAQNSRENETYIDLKKAQDFVRLGRESRCYSISYALKRTKCATYMQPFIPAVYNVYSIKFIVHSMDIVYDDFVNDGFPLIL